MAVRRTFAGGIGEEARAFHTHVLHAGELKFDPHEDSEGDGNQADDAGREQIKDTNILVVGGHEPAGEEPPRVMMSAGFVNGCIGHCAISLG